jgi:hypothetical protein
MWLTILLAAFAWFVASLALGILTGKSMALGNRPGCCPDMHEDSDQDSIATAGDLARLHEVHQAVPVFHEPGPVKR